MLEIVQIPVLTDNYTYVLHDPQQQQTAVVDPALAEPVLETLNAKGWHLNYIFNTHHHTDHTGGNLALKAKTGCQIIASNFDSDRIPGVDLAFDDGDTFHLGSAEIQIIASPGHTHGHICYYATENQALFCGDTLFSLGCGRLFEGTAEQLWHSLQTIKSLPKTTNIYCAHEYTLANAQFALTVDPENQLLLNRHQEILALREKNLPTIPVTLATELKTNPFLRCQKTDFSGLETKAETEIARFTLLRRLKDNF